MSTEPDAPPSEDDATRQDEAKDATSDDERQVVWRVTPELYEQFKTNPELYEQFKEAERRHGEQINAYSESILFAAFDYNVHADPPKPIPSPIHPDVTFDDMRNVDSLLGDIIIALRDGDRHSLNRLKYAVEGISKGIGDVPEGKEERYVFFMHYVGMQAATYHCMREDDPNRPDWFTWFKTSPWLLRCDPAFAKLDDAFVEKVCKEIVWNANNREKNHWKRAAAKIAVSVGAFDSLKMGNNNNECVDELFRRYNPKWTTIGKARFGDPDEHVRKMEALRKQSLPTK